MRWQLTIAVENGTTHEYPYDTERECNERLNVWLRTDTRFTWHIVSL